MEISAPTIPLLCIIEHGRLPYVPLHLKGGHAYQPSLNRGHPDYRWVVHSRNADLDISQWLLDNYIGRYFNQPLDDLHLLRCRIGLQSVPLHQSNNHVWLPHDIHYILCRENSEAVVLGIQGKPADASESENHTRKHARGSAHISKRRWARGAI